MFFGESNTKFLQVMGENEPHYEITRTDCSICPELREELATLKREATTLLNYIESVKPSWINCSSMQVKEYSESRDRLHSLIAEGE